MSLFKIICLALLLSLMVTAPTVAYDNGMSSTMVASESERGYVTIYLNDGSALIGKIIASEENTIKMETISGGQITVYKNYIKEAKQEKYDKKSPLSNNQVYQLNSSGKDAKPPLSIGRIAAELVVGEIAGVITAYVVTLPILAVVNSSNGYEDVDEDIDAEIIALFLGVLAGEIIGTTTTVYCIGSIGNQAGSFLATLLGSLLGIGVSMVGVSFTADGVNFSAGVAVLPVVGATIAFNLTRRYETSPTRSAIMNLQDGKANLAIPAISVCRNGKGFTSKVDLINFSF